ncbi:MAG: FtsX-like permease family protein [Acidobacteria bacterium]|nr:MAG: FtsX-like permease family protein [Acidobacteriota bacterium]
MHGLGTDLGSAWRTLRQRPWLSLAAVLSLALAIGANTAIFNVWRAVMEHPMPVLQPDRLAAVYNLAPTVPGTGFMPVSHLDFLDYAGEKQVFSGAYALRQEPVVLGLRGQAVQVTADVVTGSYFDVLGVRAALGNVFHSQQTRIEGTGALAVLSQDFFERHFRGNRGIVGTSVRLNGVPFMVLGVAPAGFGGTGTLQAPDLWAPMSMHRVLLTGALGTYFMARNAQFFSVVGRLRPGVTQAQAETAVRLEGERLARQYPKTDRLLTATTLPLLQTGIDPNQRPVYSLAFTVVLTVVGMVLLIACANVSHLLLARAHVRRHEMAVRKALGASPARLLRQLFAESLLLSLCAGAAALGVAAITQQVLWTYRPPAVQRTVFHLGLGSAALWFVLGLALLTTIAAGLAPALLGARVEPAQVLRGMAAAGGHRSSLRSWLLAGEAAFSIAALILAGLFIASLRHLQHAAPGFDAAHVASLQFDAGAGGFNIATPAAAQRLLTLDRTLLQRVRQLPGVASATLASGAPMAPGDGARGYQLFGQAPESGRGMRVVNIESVSPASFFGAMGTRLLAGRDIQTSDTAAAPRVMIVNQTMANIAWPGQNPIGKRVIFHDESEPTTVIGVAQNSAYTSLSEGPVALAYLPLAQEPATALGLTARTTGDPAALLPELQQAVAAVNPELAVSHLQTGAVAVAQSLWEARMGAILLGLLSALATLLAAIGLYGVAAFTLRQRWREMGIRIALGATRGRIFASVLRDGLWPVLGGLAVGIAAAIAAGRFAGSLLFGVGAANAGVVAGYAGLFVAIAVLALLLPARTAAHANPADVLRERL